MGYIEFTGYHHYVKKFRADSLPDTVIQLLKRNLRSQSGKAPCASIESIAQDIRHHRCAGQAQARCQDQHGQYPTSRMSSKLP